MSQSRHNPSSKSKQQHPEMLSDCASGGSRVTSYGYEKRSNPEEQCYSKSSHMLGSIEYNIRDNPSSSTQDHKCVFESQDSGFLSSEAITSEQSISSSDDLSSSATASKNINYSGDLIGHDNTSKLMRSISNIGDDKNCTDSGYLEDISTSSMRIESVTEQFSELDIKKSHLNDLNAPTSRGTISSTVVPDSKTYQYQNRPSVKTTTSEVDGKQQQRQPSQQDIEKALVQCFGQDEDGDTMLHISILQGFIEMFHSCISLATDPCLLDIPNDCRQTPLHLAVMTSQPKFVRTLLVAGASPDSKDRYGNTALHLACERGDTECIKMLLTPVTINETASVGLRYSVVGAAPGPSCLEERNYDGQLCVHLAAAGGHVEVLRHLIWSGADINARESKCGRTALHIAAERGIHQVSEFLLHECQKIVDLNLATYTGYTAYHLALYADHALAQTLEARGFAEALSESEEESDEDEEMYPLHPGEGFYWGYNGAINQQAISA